MINLGQCFFLITWRFLAPWSVKFSADILHRFDAFRSIFPAGTVSGAPKVRAIQLVSDLEKERRGVYAGAVGRFDFDRNELDTCIAIRTMTYMDGVVYLQAGV